MRRQAACEFSNCLKQPAFNKPGLKAKRCGDHKLADDIDVIHKRCEFLNCMKIPTFSQPGERAKRCFKHKLHGYIDVKSTKCEFPDCLKRPSFNKLGFKAKWCFKHKLDDDVDVKNKRCEYQDCLKQPSFNKPGFKAKRCYDHQQEGDVDVNSKRCSSGRCSIHDKYKRTFASYSNPDLCTSCHRSLHPELHPKLTVSKEQFVLAEIQRQVPELEEYFLVWDCRLNNCTFKKPDMAWRINDTLLQVEIDEGGEDHEDDENRLLEIHAVSGCKNHVVIRFNPDESVDGSKACLKRFKLSSGEKVFRLYEPSWNHRIPVLIDHIRKSLDQAVDNVEVDTFKRKLFF